MAELGEVFFANGDTREDGDLIWKTVLTEGRLEMTPGPGGKKVRKPLTVVAGRSNDPTKAIGLADLLDSFEEGVFQHVTVPTSHSNKVAENTGFVRHMRLAEEDGKHVLQAAFEFTEPEIREKVLRGTIANVSCGILTNYEKPRDGIKRKAVVEHIALTNKPWVDGMTPFFAKLSDDEGVAAGYHFADTDLSVYEGNSDNMFDYSGRSVEDVSETGTGTLVRWDNSGSMVSRQHKLEDALDAEFEDYLLVDFTPGRAVVEDENGKKFIAGYRMKDDGSIEFHPQGEWQTLSDDTELSETPEGGDNTVELAEENEALKARLEAAETALAAAAKVERDNEAKGYVKGLADLGLSEAPGFLAAVEKILLADDGVAALNLSDDEGNSVEATATDIVKSLIEALPTKDGKILLAQQATLLEGDNKPELTDDRYDKPVEERVKEMSEWLGLNNPKMVLS